MKIRSIVVQNSRRIVVDGVSVHPSCRLSADLEDGDDLEACAKDLRHSVDAMLAQHEREIRDVAAVNQRLREIGEAEKRREIVGPTTFWDLPWSVRSAIKPDYQDEIMGRALGRKWDKESK